MLDIFMRLRVLIYSWFWCFTGAVADKGVAALLCCVKAVKNPARSSYLLLNNHMLEQVAVVLLCSCEQLEYSAVLAV